MRNRADGHFTRCLTLLLVTALTTSAETAAPATSARRPVKEELFVRIGGIDQWITIKGQSDENPVVLFLHGGPGDAYSPFADALFHGWDRDFTLVQWDQRGAGKTHEKNGRSIEATLTVEQMVRDGVEVAQFLTEHLHKRKIIIVGGSWGSILGISLAHARPDLFYAYVGDAQIVNWQDNVRASYSRVLQLARASGDQPAIAALTAIGPPPWNSLAKWPQFRKWQRAYQKKRASAAMPDMTRSPEYNSPEELANYEDADNFSFLHFVGPTMSGPITRVDLPVLGIDFGIPIFMIQGQEDLVALPELARAYFDRIQAPRKQFYLVAGTGHEPSAPQLALMLKVLIDEVRPLTRLDGPSPPAPSH